MNQHTIGLKPSAWSLPAFGCGQQP